MKRALALGALIACACAQSHAKRGVRPPRTPTNGGASLPLSPPHAPAPAPASIRTIGRCDPSAPRRFTIAHVNDLQARYSDRIAGNSRYASIAGYLRKLKEEQPNTLVLDGGDDYEKGSLADLRSNREVRRHLLQARPIDARVISPRSAATS